MSMVDKTMFTSGLNLTKSSLDSLSNAGLVKEVTKQSDGSEWTTNSDGEKVPFSSMGDGVSTQEVEQAAATTTQSPPKIPFLDTDSPWHKAVPVDKKNEEEGTFTINNDNLNSTTTSEIDVDADAEKAKKKRSMKKEQLSKARQNAASDPIETLTVARLKEILRSQGLKVSGNKKELQERLRSEVQTMLLDNADDNDDKKKDMDDPPSKNLSP